MQRLLKITLILLFMAASVSAGAVAPFHGIDRAAMPGHAGSHDAGGAGAPSQDDAGTHCCTFMAGHCIGSYLRIDVGGESFCTKDSATYVAAAELALGELFLKAATPPPRA